MSKMTLDEAIEHALEVSKNCVSTKCGLDHKQLAEWLIDYKKLLKKGDSDE